MMMTSGQRLSTPILSRPQTGNIIVQVTNNESLQSKLLDKSKTNSFSPLIYLLLIDSSVSTNSDLTTQLMNDLQANGKGKKKYLFIFIFGNFTLI
jgi:hypothetical protein